MRSVPQNKKILDKYCNIGSIWYVCMYISQIKTQAETAADLDDLLYGRYIDRSSTGLT